MHSILTINGKINVSNVLWSSWPLTYRRDIPHAWLYWNVITKPYVRWVLYMRVTNKHPQKNGRDILRVSTKFHKFSVHNCLQSKTNRALFGFLSRVYIRLSPWHMVHLRIIWQRAELYYFAFYGEMEDAFRAKLTVCRSTEPEEEQSQQNHVNIQITASYVSHVWVPVQKVGPISVSLFSLLFTFATFWKVSN